jgi:hypothetical protein
VSVDSFLTPVEVLGPASEEPMEKEVEPFEFKQCVTIPKPTGTKAKNLRQLRKSLAAASEESVLHHTCQYFLSGHTLEYTNDFAFWVGRHLGEKALSEHLSNIDPYDFPNIEALRRELLNAIDGRLHLLPEPRDAMAGGEFYFSEALTLIFPVHIRARNLAEFLVGIRYIDKSSIYYHFYEARMRLTGGTDDFSKWFTNSLGQKNLGEKIKAIDPFMHTLEGIRKQIVGIIEDEVKRAMEEMPS